MQCNRSILFPELAPPADADALSVARPSVSAEVPDPMPDDGVAEGLGLFAGGF